MGQFLSIWLYGMERCRPYLGLLQCLENVGYPIKRGKVVY